jgi:hypothetical protein
VSREVNTKRQSAKKSSARVLNREWRVCGCERDDLALIPDPHFEPVTIDTIGRSSGRIQVWRNWHSDTVATVVWHGGMKAPLTADWPVSKDSAK